MIRQQCARAAAASAPSPPRSNGTGSPSRTTLSRRAGVTRRCRRSGTRPGRPAGCRAAPRCRRSARRTARTGAAAPIVSSDPGTARSWMLTMRPCASTNSMSSGISVFFIHIVAIDGVLKSNSMPASGARLRRNISPCSIWAGVVATSTANLCGPPALSMVSGAVGNCCSWAVARPARHRRATGAAAEIAGGRSMAAGDRGAIRAAGTVAWARNAGDRRCRARSYTPPPSPRKALGWTDPATGGVVHAAAYRHHLRARYRQPVPPRPQLCAAPTTPRYDQPEALITALEGGAATLLFASGMAAATAVFRRCRSARMSSCRGSCIGPAALARGLRDATGRSRSSSST